ncbi:9315_t:CDS:2 [Cetraspora pellucida]|uniref:9315_t:CDS:1 n=1 Tax=Cetraspora pellucida TaxID=1433469 RepID=A0A9N9BGU8_9GLOM|nr:9315_t:CDS:2 [Cetraspora pellucida]
MHLFEKNLLLIFLFLIITLITRCLSQTAIPAGIPSFGSPPTGDGDFTNSPKSDLPFPLLSASPESDSNLKSSIPSIPSFPSETAQPMSPKTAKSPDSGSKAPSSGSPNTSPKSNGNGNSNAKATPSIKKTPWQEKEKACIEVSGPPNQTVIQPDSIQRISWNQSPCQMEARIVGNFAILLFNSLKLVPDAKKRDYSQNGKIMYDWGPMPKVPYLNHPRITNSSDFYIRVETISRSGIFGSSVPLGGIYGPFSIELKDPPEGQQDISHQKDVLHNSLGSELWIHSIKNICFWSIIFGLITFIF